MISVLFVCTGNICRSPSAEGVFLAILAKHGLADKFHVDSAGTHGYHIGEQADPRSLEAAMKRGFDLAPHRARKVTKEDFIQYDYILAMDRGHYHSLLMICPEEHRAKVRMFLEFAPDSKVSDVPDPYYGGDAGFEEVLDLVETASEGLLNHIVKEHADLLAAK